MGCQIGSIRVLHQKLVRASSGSAETRKTAGFRRDRETPRCISALQDPLSAYFFPEYPCHGDQFCCLSWSKKIQSSRENPFPIRLNAWNRSLDLARTCGLLKYVVKNSHSTLLGTFCGKKVASALRAEYSSIGPHGTEKLSCNIGYPPTSKATRPSPCGSRSCPLRHSATTFGRPHACVPPRPPPVMRWIRCGSLHPQACCFPSRPPLVPSSSFRWPASRLARPSPPHSPKSTTTSSAPPPTCRLPGWRSKPAPSSPSSSATATSRPSRPTRCRSCPLPSTNSGTHTSSTTLTAATRPPPAPPS